MDGRRTRAVATQAAPRRSPPPGPTRAAAPRTPAPRRTAPHPPRRTAHAAGPARRTPPPRDPPPRVLARRLRAAVVVTSVLVLALTGVAWGLYRDLTAGITTTDVIAGGGDGDGQTILLVGVDSRTDAQGRPLAPEVLAELRSGADPGVLNADTIMLLHVPEDGAAAVALSIPRDTYVDIPGYRSDKINSAYPATKALAAQQLVDVGVRDPARVEAESAQIGRTTLITAVEDLTGLTVDHYAEINLLGFYNLTKAIGGVDVCLTAPVDEEHSGARFPAGPQRIAGADALAFVRQRYELPEGDLSRIRRQQVFLAAVADKILSAGTLTDPSALRALVDVAQRSLVIDSGWDVFGFAQQASDIAAGNLEFLTIPTRGSQATTRGDVVLVDRVEVRDFVERRLAEQEGAGSAGSPAPPPVDVVAGRYVVDVRNGSTTAGLAATLATHLGDLGFSRGTVDNTGPTAASVVRYTGPDGEAAATVAAQLGGIGTEYADDVGRGHLLVVIGDDFDPAMVPASAAPPPDPPAPGPGPGPITAAGVPCID